MNPRMMISREFMQTVSDIDTLELELKARKKAAFGIFLADNLDSEIPDRVQENYDELLFYTQQHQNRSNCCSPEVQKKVRSLSTWLARLSPLR